MNKRGSMVFCGSILVLLFFVCSVEGEYKVAVKGSMGSKSFCKKTRSGTQWLSEKSSALIIGKSESTMAKECAIVFGASVGPTKSVRLKLHFDFLYFDSCGVKLQINQSTSTDFSRAKDNKEIFMSGCNHKNPGSLYAQPKHFVLVSLKKTSNRLEGYNFRLNVSVAEHLPVTGAPLRVVIIVSFVCFAIVAAAAFVLFKYANHLSIEWGEERRVDTIDRAIHLYNSCSREASGDGESTMALMEPGVGVVSRQAHRPTIGFVRDDGTVIRFQPLNSRENEDDSNNSERAPHHPRPIGRELSPSEEPTHFFLSFSQPSQQDRQHSSAEHSNSGSHLLPDNADTYSIGGSDVPPSYEEALTMPITTLGSDGACSGKSNHGKTGKGKGKKKFPKTDNDSDCGIRNYNSYFPSDSNSELVALQANNDSERTSREELDSRVTSERYMNFQPSGNGDDVANTLTIEPPEMTGNGIGLDDSLVTNHSSSPPPQPPSLL